MHRRRHMLAAILIPVGFGLLLDPTGRSLAGSGPRARLTVTVLDPNGRAKPVRVRLTDGDGSAGPVPEKAIAVMYGQNDVSRGFASQRDGSRKQSSPTRRQRSWTPH